MKKIEKSIEIGGRKLTLSTGHVAGQATRAVMASYGETVVLVTVVAADLKEDWGYFPLHVEYKERLFASGRIKGSRWVKREGRPLDDEVLTARLIDRSVRPLFPSNYKKEVQIIITVLSYDLENSPDIPAAAAVSAALTSSSIPWNGPIGVVKVGLSEGKHLINPTVKELEESKMELVVSCTKDAVVMVEAAAEQVTEEKMLKAIVYAQKETKDLIKFISGFAKAVGVKKETIEAAQSDKGLVSEVQKLAKDRITKLVAKMSTKEAGYDDFDELKSAIRESVDEDQKTQAGEIFEELFKKEVRKMILSGKRPDGRAADELRNLSSIVGILPRTHGSAIFERGQTQALTVATLGAPSLEQTIESVKGEESKRYIHHYSMPPYSSGETGRIGSPKRREIGHGALAERALLPVIPAKDEFPYTIHVVTEILSSNGSTSMASTCGSTLSLMDAGVPITTPIAGIAMGAIIEDDKKFVILTDIVGIEDGNGDMDFKVAGSKTGITVLQLDVKTLKLTPEILKEAFKQAKKARLEILKTMLGAIDKPRSSVAKYAPKIKVIKIPQEKIGELIGPGGKVIKRIIAETGAEVDVEDDGSVFISATTKEALEKGVEQVEAVTKDPVAGEIYEGIVKRLQTFGAFVEILPGRDGLVHISDMSEEFVKDPNDVVSIGDKVEVRVKEIDDLGRVNLSMLLDPAADKRKEERRGERRPRSPRFGQSRSGSSRPRSHDSRNSSRSYNKKPRSPRSGPHFPTTRYLDPVSKGRR